MNPSSPNSIPQEVPLDWHKCLPNCQICVRVTTCNNHGTLAKASLCSVKWSQCPFVFIFYPIDCVWGWFPGNTLWDGGLLPRLIAEHSPSDTLVWSVYRTEQRQRLNSNAAATEAFCQSSEDLRCWDAIRYVLYWDKGSGCVLWSFLNFIFKVCMQFYHLNPT